jgi:REP element-mobilizing transposase RayT
MSELIYKKHNVSVLLYHLVCPTKYRKAVLTADVDEKLREICADIALRYEIEFLEIGTDNDHVYFLVQSVPTYSPTKIVRTIKSITAKEIFRQMPEVKKQLWGGEFWSDGYYISTVGAHSSEEVMKSYVKNQGEVKDSTQPSLFF